MGQRIDNRMIDQGESFYYGDEYRTFVETHLDHIRKHPTTNQIAVSAEIAHLYQYDLSSFLLSAEFNNSLNGLTPFHDHYLVMRVNDMTSPQEFTPDIRTLLLPSKDYMTSLVRLFRTSIGQTT